MAVRAKFYIAQITQYAYGSRTNPADGWAQPAPAGEVVMRPVTRGEENAAWASATPSGEFKMTVHGAAFPWFQGRLGAEVSILIDLDEDAPSG